MTGQYWFDWPIISELANTGLTGKYSRLAISVLAGQYWLDWPILADWLDYQDWPIVSQLANSVLTGQDWPLLS